jgi:hypothetical protein
MPQSGLLRYDEQIFATPSLEGPSTMPDSLSELKACDVLTQLFRARGYKIDRNVMFREYGVVFHIDGWDSKARVGFEFLTSEDEDHEDLDLEEYKTLMMAQQRGELSLFVMDEVEPASEAELIESANDFLDEVALARQPRGGKPRAPKKTARTKAAVSKNSAPIAQKKKAAKKKPAAKQPAAKRPAAKKTAKKAAKARKRS